MGAMKISTKALVGLVFSVLLGGCQTVNEKTVADMPTGYLCDLLSPNYVTLPSERRAIFAELEKRNADCVQAVEVRVR